MLTQGFSQACTGNDKQKNNCMHGTHVAGIVAGEPVEGSEVYGFCPFCKIMVLKISKQSMSQDGSCVGISDSATFRAFQYIAYVKDGNGENIAQLPTLHLVSIKNQDL